MAAVKNRDSPLGLTVDDTFVVNSKNIAKLVPRLKSTALVYFDIVNMKSLRLKKVIAQNSDLWNVDVEEYM